MTRYLLDSNALNAFVNRHNPFVRHLREARLRGDRIGTCEPIVAEMFYGLEFSSTRDFNVKRLERSLSQISSWPFNRLAARQYAAIAADLKRRGRKIQIVDMMLAAIAMTLDHCVVVTTDSDLSAIPKLRVIDWTINDLAS